ncbi:BspA family leucine-rich repeat surface protein [Flavobacteriaceae bacterium S356]|uniref:BspA family leucine-rich repeat surface protein n=1 Tax=Asprobacillus argus TaxID=3076534 RepID=A0ABU3LD07_9FLAO|nr:BspA family leucine-rich repeat surface protein [Flavobacteriaceae bacterium S356]
MRGFRSVVVLSLLITSFSTWGQTQDFIATFNTEIEDPGNSSIILPIHDGTYDVEIDADGDGVYEKVDATSKSLVNLTGAQRITFTHPGIYQIRIAPGSYNYNKQLRFAFNGGYDAQKLIRIDQWGTNIKWSSMRSAFNGCRNLKISASAGAPDLSNVRDMAFMFVNATSLGQEDLSTWNVSNITNMRGTFINARSFNGNISTWNVSNVTNMWQMFNNATSFNRDLNSWNTSNVSDMTSMFKDATAFNQHLDHWNVSNVQSFRYMFSGASSFNGRLGNWDLQRATSLSHMFNHATAFDQDISHWHFPNVHNMTSFLIGASGYSTQNYDKLLTRWSTTNTRIGLNFGAPPTSFCDGQDARYVLTNSYYWNITGDTGYECPVSAPELMVEIKAFLQGPHHEASGLMRDDLRVHIPLTSPYADGTTIKEEILQVTGNDAIVDWVFVELRDKNDKNTIISKSSALLQRDGDVVALDGISVFRIEAAIDTYYIVLKHRTHVPIMTHNTMDLNSTTATSIDFSNGNNVYGGTTAMHKTTGNVHTLMCGDINGDGQINTQDLILAFEEVGKSGYSAADTNMDGQVQTTDIVQMLAPFIGNGVQF